MGQKLEKLSEKDEESLDNSSWSGQTGETEQSETAEQDESRDQEDGSFATPRGIGWISGISVSGPATGHAGELTGSSARTDPQTGQPIRPLGQQEHPLNTRGERVGGEREGKSVTGTAEKSKTVLNPKEQRQTSNKRRDSEGKAVACIGTTAMEEQGTGRKSELGHSKLGPTSCDPTNEEDFVVLEKDETWMSDGDVAFGKRIKKENLQSPIKRRVGKDTSASADNLSQPSLQEKGNERKIRRTSDTLSSATEGVEAPAESSPAACFEREMGPHLAEVTGSRCRLKGAGHVGAVRAETTGRGRAEREESMNDHGKGEVSSSSNKERLSTQNSVKRLRQSADYLGDMLDEGGQEREMKSRWEPCLEKDPSLRESEDQYKESHDSGADHSHLSRFAGAVSKRAKAGSVCTKKEDCHTQKGEPPRSETPPTQGNPSFSLEQCNSIPPLEDYDGKIEVASLKREREHICFSAVITNPPVTHLLPKRDTSMATQLANDESMPKEKPKAKGPPPPVPKKPKNPFIKLKTAQLRSSDVQRRGKDHLRSEERVKRRHTFDFHRDLPYIVPTNQDMCTLWDERGTCIMPSNVRRLSVDLSPWEHLSLGHMDDQYGDMIDFDYCARVAKLSPEEELPNLDMLERRVFLERRSRFKSSPPPVARKPPNRFASTETLHTPEVTSQSHNEIQRPACSGKREIYPELPSERVSTQVNNHGDYGRRQDNHSSARDAGSGGEVGSYKPVSEIIKEKNQMQRHQSRVKPEGAKAQVRVAEEGPSVKVSQMKNAFDVPKKSKERPPEVQPSPKKGKDFGLSVLYFFFYAMVYQSIHTHKSLCYIRMRGYFPNCIPQSVM